MTAHQIAVAVSVSAALLIIGIDIGERQQAQRERETCARQEDEKELLSTTVQPNGELLCTYSMNGGFGRAKRTRRAT